MVNHFFKADLHDIMTGMRAISRDLVKSYAVLCGGFEIETDMTIFALDNGFLIKEFPIEYRDRPEGSESKLNTYSDGAKVVMTIARLLRDVQPLKFFSIIGIILLLLSAGFFIPVFREYLTTGLVRRFPTLIVCSMTMMSSLMSFFTGMILQVLRRYHRSDIERYRNMLRVK
jgi:glycosyltransferase involved in cell wall biosynthesis